MALLDRYRYAIAILIKEHRPLGPFELFSTFVMMIVIPDRASAERRSLSSILPIYLDIFPLDFLQLLSGHFHIYKNIAIDYIRTVEIHGRFADVFGRFLHHRLQSGRQTDRLLLSGDLRIWRLSVYFFGY